MKVEGPVRLHWYQEVKCCAANAMAVSVSTWFIAQVSSVNMYSKVFSVAAISLSGVKTFKSHPHLEEDRDSFRSNSSVERLSMVFHEGFSSLKRGSFSFVAQCVDSAKQVADTARKSLNREEGAKDAAHKALRSTLPPVYTLTTTCGKTALACSVIALESIAFGAAWTACGIYPLTEKFKDKIHPRAVAWGISAGLLTLSATCAVSSATWETALFVSEVVGGIIAGIKA